MAISDSNMKMATVQRYVDFLTYVLKNWSRPMVEIAGIRPCSNNSQHRVIW